jgi:hypothetical protein
MCSGERLLNWYDLTIFASRNRDVKVGVEHLYQLKEMNEKQQIFQTCPMCAKKWPCRDTFLDDPELNFNGYQPNFGIIEQGLFYFTHENAVCGSTMVLKADAFFSLFNGKRYIENKQLTDECSRKCLDPEKLDRCQAHCEFAFVREVTQIIKDRSHRQLHAISAD